ncbi:MAG: hypothetical protein ACHQK8_04935 [Bacteroidia bacterium]
MSNKKLRITGTLFFTFFFLRICFQIHAQSQGELYLPSYHYDESHRISFYKRVNKTLKLKPLPDSLKTEEQKQSYSDWKDSLTGANKDIIDSLLDQEEHKINHLLHRVNRSSHFEFDNNFANLNVFNGRQITNLVGGLIASSITFKHASGFSLSWSMYQFPEDPNMTVTIPSWDMGLSYKNTLGENFSYDASFTYSQINYGDPITAQLLTKTILVSGNYDFDYFGLNAEFDFAFGGSNQSPAIEKRASMFIVTADKEFIFYHFLGSYKFIIDPQLNVDYGSDNFILIKKLNAAKQVNSNNKKKNSKTPPAQVKEVAVGSTFYGLLAIDPDIEITYTLRNFDFYFTPHFAIPYNVLDDNTNKRTSGAGTPIFYFNTGITWRFRAWNEPERVKKN